MKTEKKLKKFNKPFAKVIKKVKALTKRASPTLAKAKATAASAMAPSKSGKKPQAKVAPKAAAKSSAKNQTKAKPTPAVQAKKATPVNDKTAKAGAPAKAVAVLAKGKPAPAATPAPAKAPVAAKGKAATKSFSESHYEKMCRENGCENAATTKGYCRLDYIKNWKKIKRKEMILKEGKLNQYIEELVGKYPDKYMDVIRQDLSSEVNFNKVIHDLELDESIDDLDYDGDSIDSLIGSIRKEEGGGFDDDEF